MLLRITSPQTMSWMQLPRPLFEAGAGVGVVDVAEAGQQQAVDVVWKVPQMSLPLPHRTATIHDQTEQAQVL